MQAINRRSAAGRDGVILRSCGDVFVEPPPPWAGERCRGGLRRRAAHGSDFKVTQSNIRCSGSGVSLQNRRYVMLWSGASLGIFFNGGGGGECQTYYLSLIMIARNFTTVYIGKFKVVL